MGLRYSKDSGFELIAYSDAYLEGFNDDCKSTSGGIQFLGDKQVSWLSEKQDYTTMSTMEAEYVSLSACYVQVIWMRTQLLYYRFRYNKIPMYCDSKSAIAISCNPLAAHGQTSQTNRLYCTPQRSFLAIGDCTHRQGGRKREAINQNGYITTHVSLREY
ncbi:hypothetical protein Tco_1042025 [Tanacetum coccineum]|uniref:Retrovirus-related Pol polyprotein from transposon TNT 1-94 n=1 Tax=Tanacetum coccineum TaxID=301880 RepID=A0ABQ5GJ58_9ASTR